MTTVVTRGAASAQALGYAARTAAANYIEDVFSTYLYRGNGSTQTITNGIDLSTKGGLVWLKNRQTAYDNIIYDTARGATKQLTTGLTAETVVSNGLTSFGASGFTLGSNYETNTNSQIHVSWTFRKQAKFFDVVAYTGNGVSGRQIAHNLGSAPGCMIIKRINFAAYNTVYHRSFGYAQGGLYFSTGGFSTSYAVWGGADPTSSVFTVSDSILVNGSGEAYVAYLFAHNAGGFGASGSDNVISCGSYTGNGSASGPSITLGYEPQWILIKNTNDDTGGYWDIIDSMRGMTVGTSDLYIRSNTADPEVSEDLVAPNATGFNITSTSTEVNSSGDTYIYIAIRRGPMKTPTSGTSVFTPVAKTGDSSTSTVTNVGFPADLFMFKWRALAYGWKQQDRLRGFPQQLASNATSSESDSGTYTFGTVNNTGYTYGSNASINADELNYTGVTSAVYAFRRAPGFFDEVCYTGTGSNTTQTHNLGAVPELIIVKGRSGATAWQVYSSALANTEYLVLNTTAAKATGATRWNSTTPTSTVFSIGAASEVNTSAATYVAYLFATVAGVSKVGSYTGTGALQTVNCGFTSGARFVLIKRTDSTGDWWVYDSARGITSGNDPYLFINSTAAEVTGTNYVDTDTTGFKVTAAAPAGLNANGGTYVFLAIA